MAKLSFAAATVLQKAPSVQLRVAAEEYEGRTQLDVREWKLWGDKKEYKPTPNGVKVPLALIDDFMAAVAKHAKELPRRVVDIDKSVSWVIGKTAADAVFKKTHVYVSEAEALSKEPPDGYKLFKVQIEKGVVVKEVKTHFRADDEWKRVKTPPPPVAKKKPVKKAVRARR